MKTQNAVVLLTIIFHSFPHFCISICVKHPHFCVKWLRFLNPPCR